MKTINTLSFKLIASDLVKELKSYKSYIRSHKSFFTSINVVKEILEDIRIKHGFAKNRYYIIFSNIFYTCIGDRGIYPSGKCLSNKPMHFI